MDLKAELKAVSGETRVRVDNCVNRILSKDIFAKYDNPPFDNSAIDGFALNEDTKATIDNFSLLEGLVKPGCKATVTLQKNEGIKILTGAPIPSGTTRIIFKENTKQQDQKIYFVGTEGRVELNQKDRGVRTINEKNHQDDINPDFCKMYEEENGLISWKGYGIDSIKTYLVASGK